MIYGAQGFTLRDYAKDEPAIAETLKKISEIGYTCLQVSAFGPFRAEFMRDTAKQYGLEIVVTHSPADRIINETQKLIDEHIIYGCNRIGLGAMDMKYTTSLEAVRTFIADFTPAMKLMHENGMKFYYHNHAFEYAKVNGVRIIDVLAEETDPELFSFLLDVYWVQVGGRSITRQFEMLNGRIDVCHFKDMGIVNNKQTMTPVMEGNLSWEDIIPVCEKNGVKYALVEQDDCDGENPFDCIKRSLDNLNKYM